MSSKGTKVFKAIKANLKSHPDGLPENLANNYLDKLEFLKKEHPNDSDLINRIEETKKQILKTPLQQSREQKQKNILDSAVKLYKQVPIELLQTCLLPTQIRILQEGKLMWIDPLNNNIFDINKEKGQIKIAELNERKLFATKEIPKNWLGSGIITREIKNNIQYEFKPLNISNKDLVTIAHYSQKEYCPPKKRMFGWQDKNKWGSYFGHHHSIAYHVLSFKNKNHELTQINIAMNEYEDKIIENYKYKGDFFYYKNKKVNNGQIFKHAHAAFNPTRENILAWLRKI